jgi:hypothetical protein
MSDELGRIVPPHVSGGGQFFERTLDTGTELRMRLYDKPALAEALLRTLEAEIADKMQRAREECGGDAVSFAYAEAAMRGVFTKYRGAPEPIKK